MRITVDGKRVEIATHRMILPDNWDTKGNTPFGKSEESLILKNYLHSLKSKIQRQYNVLESMGEEITADAIKNAINGTSEKQHKLFDVFDYHNEQFLKRVGVDYAMSSYKLYTYCLDKLKAFLKYQYHKSDILLNDLNHSFVTNFDLYLKSHDNCSHNTAMKYIKRLKKVVNFAIANEWLLRNPFINFSCSYKEVTKEFLSSEELTDIEEKVFKIKRLDQVRDIFIFCCYTGLAFADVEKLSKDNFRLGIDGEKWIIIYRKKTDTRSPIPLMSQALAIIEKYKNDPESIAKGRLLPVNSNQRMNGYLKEIADVCGITKNLTMHLARHTFATTVTLANGVPIESVSKMLGHTSIKTTQIYSKVVDTKISHDMLVLKSKLSEPKLIKVEKAV